MAFDQHTNFAFSLVQAGSGVIGSATGTTIVIVNALDLPDPAAGQYNVVVWPSGVNPSASNAEIMRVTAKATTTLTVTRAQEGMAALTSIAAGYQVALTPTAKVFADIELATGGGGGGGAVTLIQDTLLAADAASIIFNAIPGTFRSLFIHVYGRSAVGSTNEDIRVQMNGDTGSNYLDEFDGANESTAFAAGGGGTSGKTIEVPGSTATANYFGAGEILIPNYVGTVGFKSWVFTEFLAKASNNRVSESGGGQWMNTSAITSLKFITSSGSNLKAGTRITLYGM